MIPDFPEMWDDNVEWVKGDDGCDYSCWGAAFTTGLLGWCGCGDNELAVEPFIRYILEVATRTGRESPHTPEGWSASIAREDALFADDERLHYIVMYVCDEKGLTEHGGGVGGSWLTDLGKLWAERLKEYA